MYKPMVSRQMAAAGLSEEADAALSWIVVLLVNWRRENRHAQVR